MEEDIKLYCIYDICKYICILFVCKKTYNYTACIYVSYNIYMYINNYICIYYITYNAYAAKKPQLLFQGRRYEIVGEERFDSSRGGYVNGK